MKGCFFCTSLDSSVVASTADAGGQLSIAWYCLTSDQTYYCFAPKPSHHLLPRNNLFFAPYLPLSNLQSRIYGSLVFGSFYSDHSKKLETFSVLELHQPFILEKEYGVTYWQLFDKLIKTKLRSSPTFGAWRWCKQLPCVPKTGSSPRPEGAIFKLDLTWWRAPIWIRANQFKFVGNSAPFLARLRKGLVVWKWKRITSEAAEALTEILFPTPAPSIFNQLLF